jgi:hypothetical protein
MYPFGYRKKRRERWRAYRIARSPAHTSAPEAVTATSYQTEGLDHVGRSVDMLELRVFEGDATLRLIAARGVAPRVLLLLAPIFNISLVVIFALDGYLTTQNLPILWCQDAGTTCSHPTGRA